MRRQSWRRRNDIVRWFLSGGSLLVLVAVIVVIVRLLLPGVFVTLATPVWRAGTAGTAGVGSLFASFHDSAVLAHERDTYANRVHELESQNSALTAENQDLRKLLGGRERVGGDVLAGVLVRPPVAPYDTLVIDAGEQGGVRAGQFVTGPGGAPVGTIQSATGASARVLLYSAPGVTTHGWIGEARLPLTLTGRGGGAFEATLPRDAGVAIGAEVFVPGPGALPLGTVLRVESDPSSPLDTLFIQSRVNLFSLTWVLVGSGS